MSSVRHVVVMRRRRLQTALNMTRGAGVYLDETWSTLGSRLNPTEAFIRSRGTSMEVADKSTSGLIFNALNISQEDCCLLLSTKGSSFLVTSNCSPLDKPSVNDSHRGCLSLSCRQIVCTPATVAAHSRASQGRTADGDQEPQQHSSPTCRPWRSSAWCAGPASASSRPAGREELGFSAGQRARPARGLGFSLRASYFKTMAWTRLASKFCVFLHFLHISVQCIL